MILFLAMMIRYSFATAKNADVVEQAVQNVLKADVRTADIAEKVRKPVFTNDIGDAVVKELGQVA